MLAVEVAAGPHRNFEFQLVNSAQPGTSSFARAFCCGVVACEASADAKIGLATDSSVIDSLGPSKF